MLPGKTGVSREKGGIAVLVGLLLVAADARAARLQVCAFSFHGPEEVQVFKDRLPAADFDVIDLSPYQLTVADAAPPPPEGRPTAAAWLYEFRADDLPPALFENPEGIRLVDCLSPADPRVSDLLVAGLDHPDLQTRLWAAYALSRRLPLSDAILLRLAADLDDPSPDMRERLRWTFAVSAPVSTAVREAVAAHDPELAGTLVAHEPPPRRGRVFR
jgi:hypothetical protein